MDMSSATFDLIEAMELVSQQAAID